MKKAKKNLQSIIFIGTFIKILGLLYKIFITRILGIEGMRLFSMITPTLTLALTLSSLSIQTVVNQNVASNIRYQETRVRTIMKSALKITLTSSSIIAIILLFSFPIYSKIYQNSFIYYPLLICIPLIYFSNSTGVLRGYLEANEKFNYTYFANMLEQITKISITFIALFFHRKSSIELQVFICFLALTLSELSSFAYLSIKIAKKNKINYRTIKTNGYEKSILKQALPLTLEQLTLALTNYLEPFVFYYAASKVSISLYDATLYYTKVTSYAIPLLMFSIFVIQSLAKITFPKITINQNSTDNLAKILDKSFILSFLIASINLILCRFYSKETLQLLYNDSQAYEIVSFLAPLYFFTYINPILIIILQSYKQEKKLLVTSIITSIFTLLLIFILTINPIFNSTGFIFSMGISNFIRFIILTIISLKTTKYKPNKILILLPILLIIYYYLNQLNQTLLTFILTTLFFAILILFLFYFFFYKNKSHYPHKNNKEYH